MEELIKQINKDILIKYNVPLNLTSLKWDKYPFKSSTIKYYAFLDGYSYTYHVVRSGQAISIQNDKLGFDKLYTIIGD